MGDSGYEILTDSIILTDEEDEASSVASIDDEDLLGTGSGSLVDSIASLLDRAEEVEDGHDPDPIPAFGGLDDHHRICSGTTTRNRNGSCTPDEEIVFDEPVDFCGDYIAVSQRLTSFSEVERAEIWKSLGKHSTPPPPLYSAVRQCMSRELLQADEPFRVLYIGSLAAKEEIQHKLAGALAAAISESAISSGSWDGVKSPRFNIVPITSFGSRSNTPDVELVNSSGLDMTFDVCNIAKATKNPGQLDTLSLWLNGNQNITSVHSEQGARLKCAGWKLPHLAVIYCSDADNPQCRMARVYARMFMARHSVATLVITQNPAYYNAAEQAPLDPRSIHLSIQSDEREVGDNDSKRSIVHKTLPVDLSTFLSLNLRQLNRSLGWITGLSYNNLNQQVNELQMMRRQSSGGVDSATTSSMQRDVERAPQGWEKFDGNGTRSFQWIRDMGTHYEPRKLMLAGWMVFCGIAVGILGITCMKAADYTTDEVSMIPTVATMVSITTPSITLQHTASSSVASLAPVPVSASSPVAAMSLSVAPQVDFRSQLPVTFNPSDRFQIDIMGCNHVIVQPPQKYLQLRRPPPLFVQVIRNEDSVDASLSQLADGSYTLNIDEGDAWGVLKVALWTESKPIVKGDIEIDFGTPWMEVSRWMRVVEQRRAQLQQLLNQAAINAKETAIDFTQSAGHQVTEIGSIVLAKAKGYSGDVPNGLVKLHQDAMSMTNKLKRASVENSGKYVQKAQNQAKTIWERRPFGNRV